MLYDHCHKRAEFKQHLSDACEKARITGAAPQTTSGQTWQAIRSFTRAERPSLVAWEPTLPVGRKPKRKYQGRNSVQPYKPPKLLPACCLLLIHETLQTQARVGHQLKTQCTTETDRLPRELARIGTRRRAGAGSSLGKPATPRSTTPLSACSARSRGPHRA